MNKVQIKSAVISSILGIELLLVALFENYFSASIVLVVTSILLSLYFVLDLKINRDALADDVKFLIIPILFNIGSVFFVSTLFQLSLKIFFIFIVAISNYYLFVALRKLQNLEERAAIFQRNVIISVSFLALLLSYSVIYRNYVLFSQSGRNILPSWIVILTVGAIFYFVSYFLAWENGMNMKKFVPYNLVGTLLTAEIAYISTIWVINYPVFSSVERASLGGVPLPAVILTIVFYFIWGIITHKMDRSLTRKIMTEYFAVAIIFLVVLLFTAKWLPKI